MNTRLSLFFLLTKSPRPQWNTTKASGILQFRNSWSYCFNDR